MEKHFKPIWSEIHYHHDEIGHAGAHKDEWDGDAVNRIAVDAYRTDYDDDPNEEGNVIARVIKTKSGDVSTVFCDSRARWEPNVKAVLSVIMQRLREMKDGETW